MKKIFSVSCLIIVLSCTNKEEAATEATQALSTPPPPQPIVMPTTSLDGPDIIMDGKDKWCKVPRAKVKIKARDVVLCHHQQDGSSAVFTAIVPLKDSQKHFKHKDNRGVCTKNRDEPFYRSCK